MKIIIDERETALYEKCYSIIQGNSTSIQLSKQVLNLGDILIKTDEDKDVLLIERKSLSDLLSSIKDGRYEEQSYRLLHSSGYPSHSIIYMIEGMFSQLRTLIEKKTVLSAITSLNFFKGFSVLRTCSIQETAENIVWMAEKIDRDFGKGKTPYYLHRPIENIVVNNNEKDGETGNILVQGSQNTPNNYCTVVKKVKKDNVTPENIGEIILCQIPGISSINAIAIMKHFNSFLHLITELQNNPGCLENITIENNGKMRKINKSSIQNIQSFLLKRKPDGV
jgi:ERCC4-type nuclease